MMELDSQAKDMLYAYLLWRRMKISPYGASLSRWPALMVDAMDIFRIEHIRFENAEAEAQRSE